MASTSAIEWTDATWNPIRGCSMANGSEAGGCLNCYAARLAARGLPGLNSPTTGEPFAVMRESGPRWTGKVELIESALDVPLRWRKPRKIFVNSMSDLFHESLSDEAIDRVFAVMALCPQHTFQVLTKRAERMLTYFAAKRGHFSCEYSHRPARSVSRILPLENVWLGVSIENQATAKERIWPLLMTPAAIRFLSAEPLLGLVGLADLGGRAGFEELNALTGHWVKILQSHKVPRLDWVIVGGESGPGARPMEAAWAQALRHQCQAASVPFFFKQWGEWLPGNQDGAKRASEQVLNCATYPIRIGKHSAGRLLDGREWNEMPEVRS